MTVQEWLGNGNVIGHDIWEKKYRYNDETFEEWLNRVSAGNEDVRQLIKDKKFLFGGRILANRGLHNDGVKVTYSNCYVVTPPEDNIESIFDCASRMARTYSYGGGVGVDISNLAPRGAKVNNTAKQTSGAISFMDLYSLTTGLIGQNGRRGALMISLDCNHPDIEEFIGIKSDLNKVTKANISIKITDDFMQAVMDEKPYTLTFTRPETNETVTKTVDAAELFHKIAEMNWDYAEPGALFWDRIKSWNLLSNTKEFEYAGTNPCAEEPLPAGGSCLLGSINLAEFIKSPFSKDAEFDWVSFFKSIPTVVQAMNDVLDEGLLLHPLEEQRKSVADWRQIGIGIMGIADMLIKLGIRYGSPESINLCNKIGYELARNAIYQSSLLAAKDGAFPKCNVDEICNTPFFENNTCGFTHNAAMSTGLRNSQLLTIAPTGTLSNLLGISSGIEPIYAVSYTRKTESLHNKDVYYEVFTPIVKQFMDAHGITNKEDLPDYFITSHDLNYRERIDMQSVWQTHIDAAISSTINVPVEFTIEDTEDLYKYAWQKGLKGVTIFRDGCKRLGILTTDNTEPATNTTTDIPRGIIEDVPEGLTYRKYRIKSGCGKLYLFVGMDESEGKIYDCFTNTDGVGGCTVNTQANSRLLSACIRGGIPIEYVIEQLQKSGTCPSYQYARGQGKDLSKGKSCPSAIAHILKEIMDELKDDQDEVIPKPKPKSIKPPKYRDLCPECGAELMHEGGCVSCKCGYSKCS